MPVTHTVFNVSTDTGGWWQDTGPVVEGPVLQVAWLPTAGADTGAGADLQLELVSGGGADTGALATICAMDNALPNARKQYVFKQQTYDTGGSVSSEEFVFGSGQKLRAKVTPTGEVTAGKLYVFWGL